MEKSQKALPPQVRAWVEARKRHRLSHAQVQMARELGLNPGKLGKISNHRQEPWKAPLPQFIEHLYLKRFGREQPRVVTPAEKWERSAAARKPARNAVATNAPERTKSRREKVFFIRGWSLVVFESVSLSATFPGPFAA